LIKIESTLDVANSSLNQFVEINEIQKTDAAENLAQQIQTLQEKVKDTQKETKQLSPFALAFYSFLDAFDKTSPELRAAKIRKAVRTSPKETENFINDLQEESLFAKKNIADKKTLASSFEQSWMKESKKPSLATSFVPELYPSLFMMMPSADCQ